MYACEGVAGTYTADESITDTAARLGWTVISIKDDWSTVFAPS
jgi:fructose-specific phosphotransferase system component IIB